jgi:2,4-dienoyl-CoA reductase-like NADH-dependent reductase (Old Yellow Enzyme family)
VPVENSNEVYTPHKIGNLLIPNRLVRSATYLGSATEDGYVTDDLVEKYEELASGDIGLCITGVSIAREDGRQLAKMMGNFSDDFIDGLSRIAGVYHDKANERGNNSKIFLQIGHCGSQSTHWGYHGELVSSSPVENPLLKKTPKKLSQEEINEIVMKFAEATERAKIAGFDGVQYHGAHGYLITQFYSPYFNKRTDKYGGSTENRARFAVEILKESRKLVGDQFPINLKMNGSDRIEGGLELNEASELAKIFAKEGYDSLEISSYIHEAGRAEEVISLPPETQKDLRKRDIEAYNLDLAEYIKNEIKKNKDTDLPVIVVGGLYKFETIQNIIENTPIEFCSMCRPFLRQPDLAKIWKKGPPYPEASCTHCNLCTKEFLIKGPKSKGVRCILEEKLEKKRRRKQKKKN